MKTSYIAPCTKTRMIETCYILCVSGNVDPGSGSNEGEEDLGVKQIVHPLAAQVVSGHYQQ